MNENYQFKYVKIIFKIKAINGSGASVRKLGCSLHLQAKGMN